MVSDKSHRPALAIMDNDRIVRNSGKYFDSGFYCAESVLLAISESRGVHSDLIPKIAAGFCSGIARTAGMCGALTGAIMAVSMFTGRDSPTASIEDNYRAVRKTIALFEERCGSSDCFDLIGCRLDTPEGQQHFKDNKCIRACRRFTEEATAVALAVINATGLPDKPLQTSKGAADD
jgi:C_GCAxxG_C_C family probable redox protein